MSAKPPLRPVSALTPEQRAAVTQSLVRLVGEAEAVTGSAEAYVLAILQRLDKEGATLQAILTEQRQALIHTEARIQEVARARHIMEKTMEGLSREP